MSVLETALATYKQIVARRQSSCEISEKSEERGGGGSSPSGSLGPTGCGKSEKRGRVELVTTIPFLGPNGEKSERSEERGGAIDGLPPSTRSPHCEKSERSEESPTVEPVSRPLTSHISLISQPSGGFHYVTSADALPLAAVEESTVIGIDIETTSLDPRAGRVRLLSLSLETCDGGRCNYVIDLFALPVQALTPLWEALGDKLLVGFNLLFDLSFLVRLGFVPGRLWDVFLASQVLDGGGNVNNAPLKHSLMDVALRHLGERINKEEQSSDWSAPVLAPAQLAYAAVDAELPVRLREVLLQKLEDAKLLAVADLEMRALPCVVWASNAGVAVDRAAWEALTTGAEAEVARLREQLDISAPSDGNLFQSRNWNSPEQVKAAFASLGFTLKWTDDDDLAAVDHPLANLVREYRANEKRTGTYGRKWLEHVAPDGRVYPGWKQIGAGASGRMSCKEPNLQNLPRDVRYRRCFVAPSGRVLVKADYSQIELRLAAKIANDRAMQVAYRRGDDLHTLTARAILGKAEVSKADRQLAKAVNFGLLYGMGADRFRVYALSNFGISLTKDEAKAYRDKFFAAYRGVRRWHRRQGDQPVETRTVLGRRRVEVKHFAEGLNTPVQGTGADGLKAAMALLWERRAECPSAVPVLFVHDEIVVECDETEAEREKVWLVAAMVDGMQPFADPVPVEVEASVIRTWGG
jgi:DNA polymerase-1